MSGYRQLINQDDEDYENEFRNEQKTAEEEAGWFSRLFFIWVGKTVSLAYKKSKEGEALQFEDFGGLAHQDKTVVNCHRFDKHWREEVRRSHCWDHLVEKQSKVVDDNGNEGTLKWVGTLPNGPARESIFCGVEWDTTNDKGRGDGYYMGERIFECSEGKGSFIKPHLLKPLCSKEDGSPYKWSDEKPEAASSFRALFKAFRTSLFLSGVLKVLTVAAQFVQPEILRRVILFMQDTDDASYSEGFTYVAIMVVSQFVSFLTGAWYQFSLYRTGAQMKGVLSSRIYKKTFSISTKANAHPDFNTGNKVNLIDKDSERVRELLLNIHDLWAAPVMIIYSMIMLYHLVGPSVFVSLGVLVVCGPFQGIIMMKMGEPYKQMNRVKDRRLKLVYELFEGIRIVKYMVWEDKMSEQVGDLRKEEVGYIKQTHHLFAFLYAGILVTIPMLNATCFIVFSLLGNTLTAAIAFTSQSYFTIMRQPSTTLPALITKAISCREAFYRITRMLEAPDTIESVDFGTTELPENSAAMIRTGKSDAGFLPEGEADAAVFFAYTPVRLSKGDESVLQKLPPPIEYSQIVAVLIAAACTESAIVAKKADRENGIEEKEEDPADESKEKEKAAGKAAAEKDAQYKVVEKVLLKLSSPVSIEKGKLTMIIGPTGSGKTTFIDALLGNIDCAQGSVHCTSRPVYATQEAWLKNASVERNIIMESDKEDIWYNACVDVCQLRREFKNFKQGDQTEIGERGITLSGGQKQRVSLARAVYLGTDFFLFDDPLSALDAGTQRRMVEQCICGVLKGKTIVLATHQVQYLDKADNVIVIEKSPSGEGEIKFSGTYSEFKSKESEFQQILAAEKETDEADVEESEKEEVSQTQEQSFLINVTSNLSVCNKNYNNNLTDEGFSNVLTDSNTTAVWNSDIKNKSILTNFEDALSKISSILSSPGGNSIKLLIACDWSRVLAKSYLQRSMRINYSETISFFEDDVAEDKANTPKASPLKKDDDDQLIRNEERVTGKVTAAVYLAYIRNCGGVVYWIGLLMLMAFNQFAFNATDLWLQYWAHEPEPRFPLAPQYTHNKFFIIVYSSIIGVMIFTCYFVTKYGYSLFRKGSTALHDGMLRHLVTAPTSFFDTTPTGRILNRFTDDIFQVDSVVPSNMFWFLYVACMSLGNIVIQAASQPIVIAVLALISVFYIFTVNYYLPSQRETKRIDSINRTPVLAHYTETINGITTLRAYGLQNGSCKVNVEQIDKSVTSTFASIALPQYLAIRLGLMGCIIVGSVVTVNVIDKCRSGNGTGSVSLKALGIMYATSLPFYLSIMSSMYSTLEASINSVERILQYTAGQWDEVPQEKLTGEKPDSSWPGEDVAIEFDNVSLRYRPELPIVVKDLSFKAKAGQRIGIVGGTGVGKSTIMTAIFRLVEIAGGAVRINGKDTSTIAMSDLRRRISMVPQDPVLFRGTVRRNLDPFDLSTDEEVWDAVTKVNMKDRIEKHDGRLSGEVTEKAANFSLGERQLLCLARALLKKGTKLLLIDEATANIDLETDTLIQKTIREAFTSHTVITIAHRLQTIIDSDQLVVLGRVDHCGTVVEQDSPKELINSEGFFYSNIYMSLPADEQKRLKNIANADDPTQAYLQMLSQAEQE